MKQSAHTRQLTATPSKEPRTCLASVSPSRTCILSLAHVRVLLLPKGENDGFAQLPHPIRLKRTSRGHAETHTMTHTPSHALAKALRCSMLMRPTHRLYGPG